MTVMKFGGTSVKDAAAIRRTINIVSKKNEPVWVVVSAFAGITNKLVSIVDYIEKRKSEEAIRIVDEIRNLHFQVADDLQILNYVTDFISGVSDELKRIVYALEVLGEITGKSKDMIFSTGERLSSFIVYNYALSQINNLIHINSREIIRTDSNFTSAEVDFAATKQLIAEKVVPEKSVICGGFVASDKHNHTTTLGRGGSDYSAAVIAKCIGAKSLEIWTDVDGILTSDPRMIPNAMLIKEISYKEAAELAFFGAKVLHPKTIYPAVESNIPVFVLNSYNPDNTGTLITCQSPYVSMIKAIAFRKNTTVINVSSNRMLGAYGFLAKVFDVFLLNETPVDLVTTSEVSISLTIDNDSNLDAIIKDLSSFSSIEIMKNCAIISVVGEGIRDTAGIASRFFNAVSGVNISMISMGASEINLSIVVSENELEKSVKLLHNEFFENVSLPDVFVELNNGIK